VIRFASLLWLALVAVTGFATFKVKYTVQDIEDELSKVRRQTIAEQQEIHVLRAEWTALNQPERLADLNRRFLSLAAVTPKQLQRKIEDIPLRPVPEPAEPVIAAAPAPEPAAPVAVQPAEDQLAATTTAPPPVPQPAVANLQLIATAEAAPARQPAVTDIPLDRPAAVPATLKQAVGKPEARAQLAKAAGVRPSGSLDRLISEIAGSR
jgi:hypothetical protein